MGHTEEQYVVPMLHEKHYPARELMVNACLVVKGKLEKQVMRDGFTRLVKKWPRLGARLTCKKGWQVKIYIPSNPSEQSYSFSWTDRDDESFSQHLPGRDEYIFERLSESQRSSFFDQECPKTSLDLFEKKLPYTTFIHVTQYRDVACIGISVPHIMYDALGLSEVIHEWRKIMASKEAIVRKLQSGDGLAQQLGGDFPKAEKEVKQLYGNLKGDQRIFSRKEWYRFLGNFIMDMIKHPKEEIRIIFLPSTHVEQVRKRAQDSGHWISENDVVTAIMFELSLCRFKNSSNKLITLAFSANLRGVVPALPNDKNSVWLGSSSFPVTVQPQRIAARKNGGTESISLDIRQAIKEQRTAEQVKFIYPIMKESARRGVYLQQHRSGGEAYYITSWARGDWIEMDFSSALLPRPASESSGDEAASTHSVRNGNVLHMEGFSVSNKVPRRTWGVIFGRAIRDQRSGYTFELGAPLHAWPKIEKIVQQWSSPREG